MIRDIHAVEPLIRSVNDQDWYVRWGAVEALGKIGDKRAVPCLGKALDESDVYRFLPQGLRANPAAKPRWTP